LASVGSVVEKETVSSIEEPRRDPVIDGRKYILEYALKPDYAFIHAQTGDRETSVCKTAKNFNHVMATAARVTIAK
jgi:acyl CoA:acetate/3-ketoacid CoA transferase alpha subunit